MAVRRDRSVGMTRDVIWVWESRRHPAGFAVQAREIVQAKVLPPFTENSVR